MGSGRIYSIYTFPLVTKGEPKGVMKVFYRSEVKARTPDWMSFIETSPARPPSPLKTSACPKACKEQLELAIAYDGTMEKLFARNRSAR